MEVFRKIEPDRPVVCVFEDLDGIIAEDDDPKLLNWLDGFFGVDHVVNVATTNYPELLDPRVVCRPRRFDRVVKIDWPPDELRRTYLRGKLPELESPMLDDWVMKTSGLSIAALAELVISVSCLETPFEEALAVLRAIEGKAPSSEEFVHRQSMGFAANGT
jgi:SpoVK/Ycf46/Vps4 family AAA+-type ATPase